MCHTGAAGCGDDPTETPDAGDEQQLLGACTGEEDQGIDGSVDIYWSYYYDDNGYSLRDDGDRGNDGTVDTVNLYSYDDNGNMLSFETDDTNDGDIDFGFYITRDSRGYPLTESYDNEGDGVMDWVTTYTHNGDGAVSTAEEVRDGSVTSVTVFHYDDDGFIESADVDDGGDGTVDKVRLYTVDGDGNVTRIEDDSGVDGDVDSVETRMYEEGVLVLQVIDNGNDGMVDVRIVWTFDSEWRLLRQETELSIDDFNDTPDLVYALTYNADGTYATEEHSGELANLVRLTSFGYDCESASRRAQLRSTTGNSRVLRRDSAAPRGW
jgi:hypothetical protein